SSALAVAPPDSAYCGICKFHSAITSGVSAIGALPRALYACACSVPLWCRPIGRPRPANSDAAARANDATTTSLARRSSRASPTPADQTHGTPLLLTPCPPPLLIRRLSRLISPTRPAKPAIDTGTHPAPQNASKRL